MICGSSAGTASVVFSGVLSVVALLFAFFGLVSAVVFEVVFIGAVFAFAGFVVFFSAVVDRTFFDEEFLLRSLVFEFLSFFAFFDGILLLAAKVCFEFFVF